MFLTGTFVVGSAIYAGARAVGAFNRRKDLQTFLAHDSRVAPTGYALQSFVDDGREIVDKIRSLVPLSDDVRGRQMLEIASDGHVLSEEEKELNHFFNISTGVVVVAAVTSVIFPPAHIIAIPPLLYTLIPVFMDAYEGLQERRLRPAVIDCVAVVGVLLLGLAHLNPYYFMAGSLGVWIYFLSAKLLLKTEDKSRKSLTNLFGEQPRFVWLLRDGAEVEIPFEDVRVGDVVAVSAGETIPVDGSIVEGVGSVDQRMLTGESQPVEKGVGEPVFAATTMLSGRICIEVEKAGSDAVAAQIGEIWSRTADYKTSVETRGEQLSSKAVLPMLGTGALALSTLGPVGATAILLSNFSEAIQLAAPISTLNFLHLASRHGILIKDGRALELLRDVDIVVFDKTGTLTHEQPHVGAFFLCEGYEEAALLTYAAAAEARQSHPIAKAIVQEAQERQLELPSLDDAAYEVGYGIKARIEGHWVRVGSDRFMEMEGIAMPVAFRQHLSESHAQGHSLVMVAIDDELGGAIALHPTIRSEAAAMIRRLKQRDLSLCIISGDHELPTKTLADTLGIDQYFAETLPEDKATLIARLQEEGKSVCFVGDGINDAIALKQANVSISLCGATTAATDTAQIIMMDGSLHYLDHVFSLSYKFDSNLRTSFATILGGSLFCVGGVFFLHFGIYSALVLHTLSLMASVGNAYLPTINGQSAPALLAKPVEQNNPLKEEVAV